MIFVDVNTFYGPKAGGIRTYHQQKIAWFKEHPEHSYYLIGPGPAYSAEELAPNIHYIRLYGLQMTGDPEGYRLLIHFWALLVLLRKIKPDVLEAGDPWLTGLFCILVRKLGLVHCFVSSFYHSDPIRTYFEPWAHRAPFSWFRRTLVSLFSPLFFFLQRRYDLTLTASKVMEDYLQLYQVRTALTPFGAPELFFKAHQPYVAPKEGLIRLLYAGRLDQEKGIETLIEALPEILDLEGVEITVVGRGSYETFFQTYVHQGYHFGGYVRERDEFLQLLQSHHLLLAPGPFETFALGVLEALAVGLPVLGPDRGGTAEILAGIEGQEIFAAENPEDLVRALKILLKQDLQVLSQKGREIALQYGTWQQCFDRTAKLYEQEVQA